MNYEQKYKEALENFKIIKNANRDNKELVYFIECEYPELKESEDERIRKALIQGLSELRTCLPTCPTFGGVKVEDILAWLEKQGEQPSWSEEDEKMLNKIINELTPYGECPDYPSPEEQEYYYTRTLMIDWLKSIKYLARDEVKNKDWRQSLMSYKDAYEQGKQDALKHLPKWKKATEHKKFVLHVCVIDEDMCPFLDTEVEEGEYYIELDDLKTLPKEE